MDTLPATRKLTQPNQTARQPTGDRVSASSPLVIVPTTPSPLLTGCLPPVPAVTSQELPAPFLIGNDKAIEYKCLKDLTELRC